MQLKKIMVSLGILVCFCANFCAVSYADTVSHFTDYGISVLYEIANSPYSTLNIVNGTAYCISSATGENAASITVTQTLQRYCGLLIWTDVNGASWSKHVDAGSIRLSTTKNGLTSGTYRLKSVFTLTGKSGKSETITIYSNEHKIS